MTKTTNEIVERVLFYSNRDMVKYCESMLRAVDYQIDKSSLTKKKKIIQKTPDINVINKLKRSIDHYENLCRLHGDSCSKDIEEQDVADEDFPEGFFDEEEDVFNAMFDDDVEDIVFDDEIEDGVAEDFGNDESDDDDDEEPFEEIDEFKLREYQEKIIENATPVLEKFGFVYLSMWMRTGKSSVSLSLADNVGAWNVLFLTKKKAMSSVIKDYENISPLYEIVVMNYESVHKIPDKKYDVIILDEAHRLGAFPKPSSRAKKVSELIRKNNAKVILLSGTPTPESYSQMYHQVYGIPGNPFRMFKNFYDFAKTHVDIKQFKIDGLIRNDYKNGRDSIVQAMKPYMFSITKEDAGFKSEITEEILEVELQGHVYLMIDKLKKDRVLEGNGRTILADTAVKLQSKLHQMYSGTVIMEEGDAMTIDYSKAEFIYNNFGNHKVGIFYKFKEELNALKQFYGGNLTTDIDEFDKTDKTIALQIVSGSEGVSLRNAEFLVYYNIDFSATTYWQSRDRMTTIDREHNHIIWIFAKGGIEHHIYKAVSNKKDYTLKHFVKDFEI